MHFACRVCLGPFVFLLDTAEFISSALQLLLKTLNANDRLQQVLMEVGVLFLQGPAHRGVITGPMASEKLLKGLVTIHSSLNCSNCSYGDKFPLSLCATFYIMSKFTIIHTYNCSNNGLTISICIGVM